MKSDQNRQQQPSNGSDGNGKPALSVLTQGRIPFDLPYEAKLLPTGKTDIAFRRLTEAEMAILSGPIGSQIGVLKDGRYSVVLRL